METTEEVGHRHEHHERRERHATDPSCLTTLARLLTMSRTDGTELRIERHGIPNRPPNVSLRVWNAADDPKRGRGFSLRPYELAAVIAALVGELEWHRAMRAERERRRSEVRDGRRAAARTDRRSAEGAPHAEESVTG